MAYSRTRNVHLYQASPLTLTFCISFILTSLELLQYQVEAQTVDCRKSTEACVCNSQSVVEYFGEALFIPPTIFRREPRVIYDKIERFQCYEYIPLPAHILIRMSESGEIPQPSYLSRRRKFKYRQKRSRDWGDDGRHYKVRRRRQISLGYPTEELFDEAIATLPPSSKSHHYAVLGSDVTLHCYGQGKNGWEEQSVSGGFRRFEWTHGHDQPITAPLVQFDQTSGDLRLMSVRLADTGIYTCVVRSGEDDARGRADTELKSFKSQLDVIAAPMWWLRFWMTYSVDRCRHRELLEIQRQIKDVIHQYVCHFCPVRNISVNCINFEQGVEEGSKYVEVSLTISTLGLERLLPQWEHASFMCPVDCQEAMHVKVFSVVLSSLMKLFNLEILVEPIEGKTTVYTPQPQSMNDDMALGCPSGFFENYKLCFPCAAGQYSLNGKSECLPCSEGFFQPNPGSSDCFSCPKGHSTVGEGSRSQMDCIIDAALTTYNFVKFNWLYVGIGVGVGLFLLLIMILACCCCPNSWLGKCSRCTCCCGGGDENEDESDDIPTKGRGKYEKLIPEPEVKRSHHRGKPMPTPRFPRKEYNSSSVYDDDSVIREKADLSVRSRREALNENERSNQTPSTFKGTSYASKKSSRNSRTASDPSPTVPTKARKYPPGTLPICPYRIPDLNHHQLSEQVSPRPYSREEDDDDDDDEEHEDEEEALYSSSSSKYRKNPHLKFGKVLGESKSLKDKLRVQRHKLGERSDGRSRSVLEDDETSDSYLQSPAAAPSSEMLRRGNPKSLPSKPRVNIVERKNTYHKYNDAIKSKSKDYRNRTSNSSIFKKPVKERIKSFER